MRRGLLAWDEAEVPAGILDGRVARCRAAMKTAGFDALLAYTNFPRPAAVSWLTHFVPYWSQGVLLVPADGDPEFFVSLSKRVAGWIAETSRMGEIVSTPRLGADVAKRLSGAKKIGVVELDRLPGGIARPLTENLSGAVLEDATEMFRVLRQPADDAEIALSKRAADMARTAMDGAFAAGTYSDGGALVAAIEGPARLAGAEEVLVDLAPDLDADPVLCRVEGDVPLGARHAVRVSLAYKGHWIRIGRSAGDGADAANAWFADRLPDLLHGEAAGVESCEVLCEICRGSAPLSAVTAPPDGAVASVSATFRLDGRDWYAAAPVLAGADRSEPV